MAAGKLTVQQALHLVRLETTAYTTVGMVQWLFRPHPHLGGDTPAQRILDDDVDAVLELVDRLGGPAQHG